jgi:type III secretory pathway component EscS
MEEKVFYDDGENKVTNTRFVTGSQTYAISNITSVGIKEVSHPAVVVDKVVGKKDEGLGRKIFIVPLLSGIITYYYYSTSGHHEFDFSSIVGVIITIVLLLSAFDAASDIKDITEKHTVKEAFTSYVLVLTSSAGETKAIESQDKSIIVELVDAINNAIISRG